MDTGTACNRDATNNMGATDVGLATSRPMAGKRR